MPVSLSLQIPRSLCDLLSALKFSDGRLVLEETQLYGGSEKDGLGQPTRLVFFFPKSEKKSRGKGALFQSVLLSLVLQPAL